CGQVRFDVDRGGVPAERHLITVNGNRLAFYYLSRDESCRLDEAPRLTETRLVARPFHGFRRGAKFADEALSSAPAPPCGTERRRWLKLCSEWRFRTAACSASREKPGWRTAGATARSPVFGTATEPGPLKRSPRNAARRISKR